MRNFGFESFLPFYATWQASLMASTVRLLNRSTWCLLALAWASTATREAWLVMQEAVAAAERSVCRDSTDSTTWFGTLWDAKSLCRSCLVIRLSELSALDRWAGSTAGSTALCQRIFLYSKSFTDLCPALAKCYVGHRSFLVGNFKILTFLCLLGRENLWAASSWSFWE